MMYDTTYAGNNIENSDLTIKYAFRSLDQKSVFWDFSAQSDDEDITTGQSLCRTVPSFRIEDNEEDKIDSLLIQDDEDNSINQDSGSSLSYFQEERKMFVNNCTMQLLNSSIADEFIDGEISRTEQFIKDLFNQNKEAVMSALMDIYLAYFPREDTHVLKGVLELLSILPYDDVKPSGQVMALGVMRHKNKYVVKKGIQLYERWNSKEGIEIIKSLHFEETRFQKYAEQVIEYLERDGT